MEHEVLRCFTERNPREATAVAARYGYLRNSESPGGAGTPQGFGRPVQEDDMAEPTPLFADDGGHDAEALHAVANLLDALNEWVESDGSPDAFNGLDIEWWKLRGRVMFDGNRFLFKLER